jgi:N-acetylglucosamine-6-phosphate deacetylase
MEVIIQATSAVVDARMAGQTWIEVSENLIRSVNTGVHPAPDQIIDGTLIPGFVDIHCHGGGGKYFSAVTPGEIHSVIETHRGHGTTTLIASLVSEPIEVLKAQIQRLKPFVASGQISGIHLEGPYLSHARCGAHDPDLLINPDLAEIKELLQLANGAITMITIAPELPGAIDAITHLTAAGVTVALGHTAGGFKDAAAGTNAGASVITHFMNAMDKGLNENSFASFVIADERLTVELILDGHHVPFTTATEVIQAIGNRVVLVTDAMAATGSGDGSYAIGNLEVKVENSVARLTSNNALAGSTLTMDQAFNNAIKNCGVSIPQAVLMSSTNPALALGLSDRGSIAVGKRADLLAYDLATGEITTLNL